MRSVHGPKRLLAAERVDQPFDVAPAAEHADVAGGAAALGAVRGLQHRFFAEAREELGGGIYGCAVGDEQGRHGRGRYPAEVTGPRTAVVTTAFTMGLAKRHPLWHSRPMSTRSPQAGGCLLVLCIFLGVALGAMRGQPSLGFLIGAGLGVLAAVAVWLLDRRREP